jgi:NAD(P)-dependent dehydrogenase (short-subunit alcohol dehydrogenase family)
LKDDQTYLVVGGLGGIGKALVRHLAGLGAKHIATLSRSGADNENKSAFVREMREAGVNLIIQQGSVTEIEDVKKLKDLVGKRSIRGIIQGAMVLQVSQVGYELLGAWNPNSNAGLHCEQHDSCPMADNAWTKGHRDPKLAIRFRQ